MILKKEHSNSLKIKIVQVIRIWNLRFAWYLMLVIWDFVDSLLVFSMFDINSLS